MTDLTEIKIPRDEYMNHVCRMIEVYEFFIKESETDGEKTYESGVVAGLQMALDAYTLVNKLGPDFEEKFQKYLDEQNSQPILKQ